MEASKEAKELYEMRGDKKFERNEKHLILELNSFH
jgi:hypothetical protein